MHPRIALAVALVAAPAPFKVAVTMQATVATTLTATTLSTPVPGSYTVVGLAVPGTYQVTITKPGYESATRLVNQRGAERPALYTGGGEV